MAAPARPKRARAINPRDLDDVFLECRIRHAMMIDWGVVPVRAGHLVGGCGVYWRCERGCGRWQIDWYVRDEIVSRSSGYDDPDYLNTGHGRVDRNDIRREVVRRVRTYRASDAPFEERLVGASRRKTANSEKLSRRHRRLRAIS